LLLVVVPWVWRTVLSERTVAGRLKPFDVDRVVEPGKYADGDGLYLVVVGGPIRQQLPI
jgi:hypothetical protein